MKEYPVRFMMMIVLRVGSEDGSQKLQLLALGLRNSESRSSRLRDSVFEGVVWVDDDGGFAGHESTTGDDGNYLSGVREGFK